MKAKESAVSRERGEREERYDPIPDVTRMVTEFDHCVDRRDQGYWSRQRRNYDSRRCLWPGKQNDGRKHRTKGGPPVFPWEGASDIEVPLADKYIREDVALLMNLWSVNRVMVKPTQPSKDAGWANRATQFLRWMIYEHIEESEDEAELAANLYLERGHMAVTVVWDRTETLVYESISMKQIEQAAMMAQLQIRKGSKAPQLQIQAILPQLIMDPTQQDTLVDVFAEMLGQDDSVNLSKAEMGRLIRDLRTNGTVEFPKVDVLRDRPTISALALNEDLWLPPEATSVQKASRLFRRELLTETEVQERVRTMDWDAAWVDQMIETQRGRVSRQGISRMGRARRWSLDGVSEDSRLFEVLHTYERQYDERGVPGIWYTCLSRGVKDRVATHSLLNYAHGQFPFALFSLERRSRSLDDSRGYGERGDAFQRLIKVEWDGRIDRSSMATLPPSYHPPGEAPDEWGPGVQISTRKPEAHGFMSGPRMDPGSKEVEDTVRRFADEYFGRPVDEQNVNEANLLKQELVRGWMRGWKGVYKQVMQLCQQFCPDEIFYRVVGDEQGRLVRATRDDIQGTFNVVVTFNVRDLDLDYVKSKMELLKEAISLDTTGRIDRDELLRAVFELVDPGYGERLLRPAEHASMSEVEDEKRVMSQLLLGIPVDIKPGQAYGLRLQTLQALVQQSPTVRKLIEVNPQAKTMVETRAQQMKHQLDQAKNAQTGKFLGTRPMNEQMQQEGQAA